MTGDVLGYGLVAGLAVLVGLVIGLFVAWLLRGQGGGEAAALKQEMREAFDSAARQSLKDNAEMFLSRTKDQLSPLQRDLDKLEAHLRELEQKREGAYQGLREHLRNLSEAQKELQRTTTTLSQAMRSTRARGQWGEIQLRRLVEMAGLLEHVDFEEQPTAGDARPDMVVRLPNGGILPIDAKVPMNAYLEAVEAGERRVQRERLEEHVVAMRGRIRELGRKGYWDQFERAPQFVVMFVPNEACFSTAFQTDGNLLDYALKRQVIVTSPVSLLALLKAVAYGWQQVQITENARKIADEGKTLYKRLAKVAEHIQDVGAGLEQAFGAYNRLIGSFEVRLLPSARRFEELGIDDVQDLPQPERLEETTRDITAGELQEE